MHDHRAGLPRNMPRLMIGPTETNNKEIVQPEDQIPEQPQTIKTNNLHSQNDGTLNATTKICKHGDGTQRKRYGQCWECGGRGHPRRECETFLKRMGKRPLPENTISITKGICKYWKNCKWGKGKSKRGKTRKLTTEEKQKQQQQNTGPRDTPLGKTYIIGVKMIIRRHDVMKQSAATIMTTTIGDTTMGEPTALAIKLCCWNVKATHKKR